MILYQQLNDVIEKLKPIAVALDIVQGDKCRLADAVKLWLKLDAELPNDVKTSDVYCEKRELALTHVALASYMLHPVYREENLSADLKGKGRKWLSDKHPIYVGIASHLEHGDEDFFPETFLNIEMAKGMEPEKWWRGLKGTPTLSDKLIDLAESLMLLPSSTAGIERSFSTMGDIITDDRNSLGIEKAGKLCSIYKTLKNHYSGI